MSRTIRFLAAATLAAGGLVPGALRAETVALTGGTVHTASGPTLPNATVVITDGRIAAVGANVEIPAGARTVSVAGKHVYPGIISPNTVLGLVEVRSVAGTLDEAEVGDLNPNVRAEVAFNPSSAHIPVARLNGITSVHVIPAGPVLSGTSALMHMDGWTPEDMTLRAPVGLVVRWPDMTPVRRFGDRRTEEEQNHDRDAALAEIENAFNDARAYWKARDAEGTRGIPRHDRDVKWAAMKKALDGDIPVMFVAAHLNQIRAALDFADEQGLQNLILVGGNDAWQIADELKRRDVAVTCDRVFDQPQRSWEPYDRAFTLPAKLHDAGVRFCISDGAGSPGEAFNPMNTRNLPYEAGMASAFGLSREEALRAITLYPAQILGVGDRLGSIEPGKIADLVVTDGDMLEITTHVEQVWINGRSIPMESHQTRLYEKWNARPKGAHARKAEGGGH
jgi:imidazolonepropionase-like amidohydrolase